jgi:hypothetical protein
MRALRDTKDVQLVLKELMDWKDKLTSKDWNFTGLRIRNASPSLDDYDYVVRKELKDSTSQTVNVSNLYSICFQSNGTTLASGTNVASSYIVGLGREGIVVKVYISLNSDQVAAGDIIVMPTLNGVALLKNNLVLPAGSVTTFSSYTTQPNPRIKEMDLLNLDIISVSDPDASKALEVQVQVQLFGIKQ